MKCKFYEPNDEVVYYDGCCYMYKKYHIFGTWIIAPGLLQFCNLIMGGAAFLFFFILKTEP